MNSPKKPMRRIVSSVKSSFRRAGVFIGAAVLAAGLQSVSAQSVGCKIVSGSVGGIDNTEADSMLPTDLAGVPAYAQTNWNNLSSSGSGTFVLTNSTGATDNFNLAWSCGFSDTTGTGTGLGTPDGKLMDEFLSTWGPGAASSLGNSPANSAINDQPIVYASGLNAWYNAVGAEGYGVVTYCNGYSYYETFEGYIESVSGDPLNNTMVEGTSLTPHQFNVDTSVFNGTYVPVTSANSGSPTYGGNYMFFTALTNDAVLIRMQVSGYSSAINAFQFVPIFPTPPTANAPAFSPSSTVYAEVPVTITETASGDPFHTNLWYQWYSDNGTGGDVTNVILSATNVTLNVTPTNNATTYGIQYLVVVTNIFGSSTSAPVVLTVNPAVAPFVILDTTPGPGNGLVTVYAYAGGSVSFSALFDGTPGAYLWQSNLVSLSGSTTTNLTLNNLSLSASASYDLTDTNSVGGAASTPAPLVVLTDPIAPDASTAYPYDVFTNGPAAYWRFSETLDNTGNSVQAYDYSGNKLDATYGTAVSDQQSGPQPPEFPGFETTNSCVALVNNENNSFLTAPSLNLNTNTVTITAWINPGGNVGADWALFTWVNGSDKAGFGFGGSSSNNVAELGYTWDTNSPSTYNFNSGLYPPVGEWSFVALTITPTNSTIYLYYVDVNNTGATNLFKSVQSITNIPEAFSGGTTWIGGDGNISHNFSGLLDEVAVFKKSLSEAQVQDLFLKAIGAQGVAPAVADATIYPAASVYSGQNVELSSTFTGSAPLSFRWQSSPDGNTWTDVAGAASSTLLVNPLTVGSVYYHLIVSNPVGSATNDPAAVTFSALPATPPGMWTVNYQVTNNVLNYTTGAGIGHYTGRGIFGAGNYWNVLPDNAGAYGYLWTLTSASDFQDDGVTHSGIYCTVYGGSSGFGSSTAVQPDSSDIGNLLYQWVTIYNTNDTLQIAGLPDGTYNLCFYGCDGYFNDRGTTFVAHDAKNGNQTAGTVNASPILPLQQGVNFVVMSNVHVAGGTLDVDILPTSPVPTHNPNTEADFNGMQLQLVSYDLPPPTVYLNNYVSTNGAGGSTLNLNWSEGILQTSTNLLGPWTPIYSSSPVTMPVTTTNSAQFFRVKVE
jgi:hypothetical protein